MSKGDRDARVLQDVTGARYSTCLARVRALRGVLVGAEEDALDVFMVRVEKLPDHQPGQTRCVTCLGLTKTLDAQSKPKCDFRDAHDAVADLPTGNRCGAPAAHRIEWADGRFSFGCEAHLEIDDSASVKPIGIVPLNDNPVVTADDCGCL
jgi:hypothetical protein